MARCRNCCVGARHSIDSRSEQRHPNTSVVWSRWRCPDEMKFACLGASSRSERAALCEIYLKKQGVCRAWRHDKRAPATREVVLLYSFYPEVRSTASCICSYLRAWYYTALRSFASWTIRTLADRRISHASLVQILSK